MEPGDLVLSVAGRDKDRYYIVMEAGVHFCMISDGDIRKCDRPKKKKIKHVVQTGFSSEFIKKRFAEGQKVTNTMLRNEINKFVESLNPSAFPVE